jgi:trehalose-6-phosphate synthase
MEYTYSQWKMGRNTKKGKTTGMLIISEFVSSARLMRGGLIFNPWKPEEVRLSA